MRTLIIKSETLDQLRKDVYNFLLEGNYREVIGIKKISDNYVHVYYYPKLNI